MKTINQLIRIVFAFALLFSFNSCSKDDDSINYDTFVVAFNSTSANLMEIESQQNLPLVYSASAKYSGTITVAINAVNAIYGEDFTTTPAANDNILTLSINTGETTNTITFNKLNPFLDETTEITFTIIDVDYKGAIIQGNNSIVLNGAPVMSGVVQPELGGPNEGNQVYVDLSGNATTLVQRDSWDLGFYSGNEFRVGLNGSIYMAAALLNSTDIDAIYSDDVTNLQPQVAIGTFDAANEAYVDAPNGDIMGTAIEEVSDNPENNKVYLLNLGYEIGTETPTVGTASVIGEHRGWMKIRVLKDGENYVLQYANLDDTNHQEVSIGKDSDYNFSFFSFNTKTTVSVEPEKEKWDMCFTVFTNIIEGNGSYGYSDFVVHNRKGGVTAYQVDTDIKAYDEFVYSDLDESQLQEDQRVIGSNWRDVFEGQQYTDRYYILKDPNGNFYKIKFLALSNDNGIRGYPEFQFELLTDNSN